MPVGGVSVFEFWLLADTSSGKSKPAFNTLKISVLY